MEKLPIYPAAKLRGCDGAEANQVFLFENCDQPPAFIRFVKGWKPIGYTRSAPWPGSTDGFAVVLEKTMPAERYGSIKGEECEEGTKIWQHFREKWLREMFDLG